MDATSPELRDEAVHTRYDWSKTTPSTAVVETVATALDRDPTSLEPLYGYVDPDALDTLVRRGDSQLSDVSVSFPFDGQFVTVHDSGDVVVQTESEQA